MKKEICLSLFVLVLIFSSCKKNSPAPATATQSSGGTPYAEMTVLRTFSYNSGTLILNGNHAYADFRSDVSNINSVMQIGSLNINGVGLKFQSGSKTYADTSFISSIVPGTWQIVGAGPIPSYTYTNNDSLPVYSGYVSLPDTISKNQNLALQINGVSGAGMIDASLYNSTGSVNVYKVKSTGITINNTLSFTPTDLSPLPIGGSSVLVISLFKYNYQHVGNVTFSFATQLEINKTVYIK